MSLRLCFAVRRVGILRFAQNGISEVVELLLRWAKKLPHICQRMADMGHPASMVHLRHFRNRPTTENSVDELD
jgi:hypothetical protein